MYKYESVLNDDNGGGGKKNQKFFIMDDLLLRQPGELRGVLAVLPVVLARLGALERPQQVALLLLQVVDGLPLPLQRLGRLLQVRLLVPLHDLRGATDQT